eukprot:TRINITY_DN752_c0_g1_i2.p1 TRINITY_DN752_c0_g1~~TRINITY_DN752_c0_g1_i2.p1  ORF type:complete len:1234 (+),score=563.16 TRINITY_DN752_c0_g1_i2:123-3704(+)
MAGTRKDVLKKAGALEARLGGKQFLGGARPSREDAAEFRALLGADNVHVARWAKHIAGSSAAERKGWAAPPKAAQKRHVTVASVAGPAKETKADRKAAYAAAADVHVARREVKREKQHPDCLDDMHDQPNFSESEEEILAYWTKIDAFKTSLKKSEGRKPFSFYDGPPFATGLPHYGHILAGTIKDVVCRWAHLTGHYVERRFGWDCHGLPIEFEIEKQKGIKSSKDIIGPGGCGIAQYNEWCREIVMRYAGEWEMIVTRMARWIDFKNDYKTMNLSYMESVWWVFRTLWDKGLVYRGYKVMPYSYACTTVLSNHEAGMNYNDVNDPSVVVNFPWVDDPEVKFLAWTTTPWTLPSNLALCVGPEMDYQLIKDKASGNKYILAKSRMVQLYPKLAKGEAAGKYYEVLEEYKGKQLVGRQYEPLFDFFLRKKADGCFKVIMDTYVTEDSGTGIVHQAPGFGEDDYRVCIAHGLITKDEKVPCPVDENGEYTDEVPDWKGVVVKEADKDIAKVLKERGRLVSSGTVVHSYPFCWRSDKPLIYKACPSWFVNVERIKDKVLESSEMTRWVPEAVRSGRFNNLVKGAPDWAVSRSRYWGCPLPVWHSEDWEVTKCIGSVKELEELCGQKVTDLHRHHIDHLTIPDPRGGGRPPLKRVSEVFDCWFESGSMPYGQCHYPFENKEKFESSFPADFIAEGVDQTRGWFMTLLVLSTACFEKACFRNLIVNGLVLAADGKKMSKRLKNYPDPLDVVRKHCADALRLYLINSPVVHGQELRFKEEGVRDVVKEVMLPIYHALKFFTIQHNRLVLAGHKFDPKTPLGANVMDQWVLATSASLVRYLKGEMEAYRLSTVLQSDRGVMRWVDNLTNWYVRMNRSRLKGSGGLQDWQQALATLFRVLEVTARVMASFTPYIAEQIWLQLRPLLPEHEREDSVHYTSIPEVDESLMCPVVERRVERMQKVARLVRYIRDRKGVGLRKPVKEIIVIHRDAEFLDDVQHMAPYIREEVNTFEVSCTSKEGDWVVTTAEPCLPGLGKRFGKRQREFAEGIKADPSGIAKKLLADGEVEVRGEKLGHDEVSLVRTFREGVVDYETHTDGSVVVLMSLVQDEAVLREGASREFVSRVQTLRKRARLQMTDKVKVWWECADETLTRAVEHNEALPGQVNAFIERLSPAQQPAGVIASQESTFGEAALRLVLSGA